MTALLGPGGVQAHARVVVEPGRSGPRLRQVTTRPPLGVRLAGGEVWLAATAGGPHGGDDLTTEVLVTAGTTVTVRSVAATVALPGDGTPSRSRVHVIVEPGARLEWLPEPLVAAAGCDHRAAATVDVAADATLLWREEAVLGRSGEPAGALRSTVRICRDGRPVLVNGLDTTRPGWDGPAVTAGAGVVGMVVVLGGDDEPAEPDRGSALALSRPEDGIVVVSGTAPHHAAWRSGLRGLGVPRWAS